MTAEVAVMNRMGVALAADSAVTIGSSANKIYTSAEKLFQLSESAPVGVMIYGNAGYVSLPWETIIKAFRRQLGGSTRATIAEYCDQFVSFMHSNPELFPPANRQHVMRRLVYGLLEQVRIRRKRHLDNKRKEKPATNRTLTADEIRASLGEVVAEMTSEVTADQPLIGTDAAHAQGVKDEVSGWITEVLDDALNEIERPAGVDDKLFDLSVEYLTRQTLGDFTSGVVIAGFGEREYMPALASFEVEECAGELPRRTPISHVTIAGDGRRSFVMPYAQQDSVIQFLFGVDNEISSFMSKSVQVMTDGLIDLVLDKVAEANSDLANALRSQVKDVARDHLKQLAGVWDEEQRRYFHPVLDTIAVLPKDELAAMAEAFVNLTKFRRRVTPVAETVSGPIDVAVITKGDGFVWIRRKHYFAPEINPRVMARFYNPGGAS